MKFLIIQEQGRHEISRHLRECNSLQRAIIANGEECDVWGLGHANYATEPNYDTYDVIVNLENYDTGWAPDLRNYRSPIKLLWSIDAHVQGYEYYKRIFDGGNYTKILQATKDFCCKDSVWFPNCYDDKFIYPQLSKYSIPVGFCGNYVNRKPLFDYIKSKIPEFHLDIDVRGQDMINAINSYRIGFNKNIGIDVNYRNFETMGCGTMLITDKNHQYDALGFKHTENCLIYSSPDEAVELIKYAIDRPMQMHDISQKGLELVQKKHTFNKRAEHLIKYVKSL